LSIVDAISSYHEEGKVFYPEIFLTTDVEELFKAVPTSTIISIGEKPLQTDSFRTALKTCAPLATEGWSLFIERTSTRIRFGLVRSGDSILALPVKESLFSGDSRVGVPVIRIAQASEDVVEVMASCGRTLQVVYSGTATMFKPVDLEVGQFAADICKDLDQAIRPTVVTLFQKILRSVVKESHGSLAIVVSQKIRKPIVGLEDGLWLANPVGFVNLVDDYLRTKDVLAAAQLTSLGALVKGMMCVDGITVFNSAATVLAYNVFAKPSNRSEQKILGSTPGGARKKTYNLLCSRLGGSIRGCYFLSQDGQSEYSNRRS
jgi:hypothetical protein